MSSICRLETAEYWIWSDVFEDNKEGLQRTLLFMFKEQRQMENIIECFAESYREIW